MHTIIAQSSGQLRIFYTKYACDVQNSVKHIKFYAKLVNLVKLSK